MTFDVNSVARALQSYNKTRKVPEKQAPRVGAEAADESRGVLRAGLGLYMKSNKVPIIPPPGQGTGGKTTTV